MEFFESFDPLTVVVLVAACVIIVLALFSKFITGLLKIGIITTMAAVILYFLRQAGII